MARPFRVLSIDGGGIKGIIPAKVLVKIEEETGKKAAELFDLIIGTSTGGILALGLTKPVRDGGDEPEYGANDLVGLYKQYGEMIFPRSKWRDVLLDRSKGTPSLFRRIIATKLRNIYKKQYPAQILRRLLASISMANSWDTFTKWAMLGSNQQPLPCEGSALLGSCVGVKVGVRQAEASITLIRSLCVCPAKGRK
jgi:hypothetical protein